MSDQDGTLPAGADVTFVQYLLPPLRSGEVTVAAAQVVEAAGAAQTFVTAQRLSVAGARYRLGPDDVAGVFPPPGSQGEFADVLPHVVLSSPTLPWQRAADPAAPPPAAGDPVATWLAVLPFRALDPPPVPHAVTVGELAPSGTVFFPPRTPEAGEANGDPVTVIDVPVDLFAAVAPTAEDLGWLAHVRRVDVRARPAGDGPPQSDFGVVMGNRLGLPGQATTAVLVSLEGWAPYLPAADGTPSSLLPEQAETVRLVVLHSWTYSAVDQQQTFAGLLTAVSTSPSGVQLPVDGPATGDASVDALVADAGAMGYTAMDHGLANGDPTVSWYRGPLLPLGTPRFLAPPHTAASPLMRYDPTTGMFDVTYAAAWSLGRLMALHDNAFATALYRWKLTQARSSVEALETALLDETLGDFLPTAPGTLGEARRSRFAAAAMGVAAPAAARLAADSAP